MKKYIIFSQKPVTSNIWLTERICFLEIKLFDDKLLNMSVTSTVPLGTFIIQMFRIKN